METKEYEKPQVIYQEQLEAVAGVCTPGPPNYGKASYGQGCTTLNS